ncbi:MAG: YidH family protein [Pirellulales bacterium]
MQESRGRDELASERTLLAAERTFSAWIRTGLAALGGGLAVARALVFKSNEHQAVARVIGWLLVIWGASIFVYAIIGYRRTCARLSQEGVPNNSLGAMILMTAMLLIIATLVFWITLQ